MGRPKGSKNLRKKLLQYEWRVCKSCNSFFQTLENSKKVYCHGHNNRGKSLLLGYTRTRKSVEQGIATRQEIARERGYYHSEETKRKAGGSISKAKTGKPYTEKTKQLRVGVAKKISEATCRNLVEHPEYWCSSRYKQGWIELPRLGRYYYLSSWEEAALINLDKNTDVLAVVKDKVRVPYIFEGSSHFYVIDFQIHMKEGITYLVEVKPDYLLTDPQTMLKIEAGRKYAASVGIDYQIWNDNICFNYDSVTTMLSGVTQIATTDNREIEDIVLTQ